MTHPNAIQIRKNRLKLMLSRISFFSGLALIAYDYYLTYLTPYWDYDILLAMFIAGLTLTFLGFAGKLWRRYVSRYRKGTITRHGECVNCGKCCKIPVRCVFLYKNKCTIHHNRPKQCREYPVGPEQLVGADCGYWFE